MPGLRSVLGRSARAGALACAGVAVWFAVAAAADGSRPVAVGAKLERAGEVTRLTFDLSAPVSAGATLIEAPDRVVVDLPRVDFQVDPAVRRPGRIAGGLVRSFRFGLFAPGRSRVVIDLAAPSLARVTVTSIAGSEPSRLVIELDRTDRAGFHRAAQNASAVPVPPPAAASVPPAKAGALPVVVIDPGHGGIDPGASGNGVVEKAVVFDFASLLADKLKSTGRYAVVMTRHDDSFVSLGERVALAREAGAALFVSIHADSLAANAGVAGSTVYIASDKASDAEAARVAESENQADAAAGVAAVPEAAGVDDILFDLTRQETRTYAHSFQRTLVGYWEKIAHLNKNPERAAGFRVLQAPDVPSVLLELGYLSCDRDVKNLTAADWRDHATTSVVAAVDSFFAPRQGRSAAAAPVGSLVRASAN